MSSVLSAVWRNVCRRSNKRPTLAATLQGVQYDVLGGSNNPPRAAANLLRQLIRSPASVASHDLDRPRCVVYRAMLRDMLVEVVHVGRVEPSDDFVRSVAFAPGVEGQKRVVFDGTAHVDMLLGKTAGDVADDVCILDLQ